MKRFFLLCSLLAMAACAPTPPPPAPPPPPPPPAPPPPPPQHFSVYFPLGSAQLTSDARQIVAAAANALKGDTIQVSGHTDTSGSAAANNRLSIQRARSVARALIADGVPQSSLQVSARGEKDLAVPTGNNVRDAQNRRVEIYAAGAAPPSASEAPPPGAMENAPPPSGAGAPPPPPPPAE